MTHALKREKERQRGRGGGSARVEESDDLYAEREAESPVESIHACGLH